jgi:lambda repressor-like predicted transcriptional regulator
MLAAPTLDVPDPRRRMLDQVAASISAGALASLIADAHGLAYAEVVTACGLVPDNLLSLLDSPQGWTMLADLVAMAAAVEPRPIVPTRH